MKKYISQPAIILTLIIGLTGALSAAELEIGSDAPDFILPYASPDTINFDGLRLSQFQGKKYVVLAFYPADWSPGCTTQMCNFRDNFRALDELDAEIIGVSGDYVFSHQAWIEHHGIQFKLASDHQHKVARMYNSYRPKIGMNKRTVFVIDKQGKISYINMDYSAGNPQDFEALQQHLASLSKSASMQ